MSILTHIFACAFAAGFFAIQAANSVAAVPDKMWLHQPSRANVRSLDEQDRFQPLLADRAADDNESVVRRSPQSTKKTSNGIPPAGNNLTNVKPTDVIKAGGNPATTQPDKPYISTLNQKDKSDLKQFCDVTKLNEDRNQKQLLFTSNQYNNLTSEQVTDKLYQQCSNYRDQVEPQYQKSKAGYYDNNKSEPKVETIFAGGRIPGQKDVFAASCEVQKITSPKWYGSETDAERVKQQVNVNGQPGVFTDKFISSIGGGQYNGKGEFCQGATNG